MKKACIFGAGQAGMMAVRWLPAEYNAVCYIDNKEKKQNQKLDGLDVISFNDALKLEPDMIWIAVLNKEAAVSIRNQIEESGFAGEILDIADFRQYQDIRVAALRLIAQEIKERKVPGEMAELGVFRGDFSAVMNELFPEKELYLFDTFEGFSADEIEKEVISGDATDPLLTFTDTSVELVLEKMNYSNKVVIKKGLFPDTATDVEDTFCFVSIDCDLYDSITYGLEYYYPRLEKGGYIFIHDYINKKYKGAKRAVQDYCDKNGISYTVNPDACGTAIIAK